MEAYERFDRDLIPKGYGRVKSGPVFPSDLIWSWPTREWLRADSPDWGQLTVDDAADAVCVIRTGRPSSAGFGGSRTYTVRRGHQPPVEAVAAAAHEPRPDAQPINRRLFD